MLISCPILPIHIITPPQQKHDRHYVSLSRHWSDQLCIYLTYLTYSRPWRCQSTYWQLIHEYSPAFSVLGDPWCILYASESHLFTVLPNLIHPSLLRPSPYFSPHARSTPPLLSVEICFDPFLQHDQNKADDAVGFFGSQFGEETVYTIVNFLVPDSVSTCDSFNSPQKKLLKNS